MVRTTMLGGELARERREVVTDDQTAGVDELSTCPLCGLAHGERTDLRVHLMTTHSKSDLTEELLRAYEEFLAA
ncbi:hypothetical protein SAMN04487948_12444 [Halogranum amylolyticum]|uniref:C2H2-type domain-containing protein n=1 Tax=Halogranum amylolyticum TaxID=660520 RepID=A0A1H8W6V0_9EURY|nr:hypothetical protein [Halogranum amylolyticum]SEP23263.1 hypothetical protein SAMN04487948_12444 [Halogranum amylolyticum]